ncbi:MAG: hypothetical protein HYW25_02935 [Candidatus Aenigmarchaeota archaeon]|nr:hypothetical protein [Candidatus Aenigmarchaeota archaeon]
MPVELTVKRVGNSIGVIFPKNLAEEKNLHENEKILIEIVKEADLSDVFGTLERKMSGQKFKDMVKSGWR